MLSVPRMRSECSDEGYDEPSRASRPGGVAYSSRQAQKPVMEFRFRGIFTALSPVFILLLYDSYSLTPPPPRSRLAAWVPEQPADVDALPAPGDHLTHPLTRLHLAPLPLTQPVQAGGARATTVTKPMQKNQLLPPYSTGILKHLGRGLQLI